MMSYPCPFCGAGANDDCHRRNNAANPSPMHSQREKGVWMAYRMGRITGTINERARHE